MQLRKKLLSSIIFQVGRSGCKVVRVKVNYICIFKFLEGLPCILPILLLLHQQDALLRPEPAYYHSLAGQWLWPLVGLLLEHSGRRRQAEHGRSGSDGMQTASEGKRRPLVEGGAEQEPRPAAGFGVASRGEARLAESRRGPSRLSPNGEDSTE